MSGIDRHLRKKLILSAVLVFMVNPSAHAHTIDQNLARCEGNERALQDLSRYITLAPRDVRAFDQRGTIYASTGNFERAIANFDEVIRLAPESAAGFVNRGQAYAKAGNWTLAIADFDQAIRLRPDMALLLYVRGLAK